MCAVQISLAKTSGFCFGVDHAVKEAYRIAGEPSTRPVVRLGPPGALVLIRAPGVPPAVQQTLHENGGEIRDLTCPFVSRIHDIVRAQRAAGRRILIAGSPDHPEVRGIAGHGGGDAVVIESAEQAERFDPGEDSWALVSQTTFSYKEYEKIMHILDKKLLDKLQIFDTICSTTESRQKEALELARASDVMIVIGSRSSSNTSKLLDTCLRACASSYIVDGLDSIPPLPAPSFIP
jgi:4-hydroxy-3-methylbut-2-enyl diphosphate reductase